MDAAIEADIARLNLEYLRLVREVAARDAAEACAIFGMGQETALILASADRSALERIAACGLPVLAFAPRSPELWRSIASGRARPESVACGWDGER